MNWQMGSVNSGRLLWHQCDESSSVAYSESNNSSNGNAAGNSSKSLNEITVFNLLNPYCTALLLQNVGEGMKYPDCIISRIKRWTLSRTQLSDFWTRVIILAWGDNLVIPWYIPRVLEYPLTLYPGDDDHEFYFTKYAYPGIWVFWTRYRALLTTIFNFTKVSNFDITKTFGNFFWHSDLLQ